MNKLMAACGSDGKVRVDPSLIIPDPSRLGKRDAVYWAIMASVGYIPIPSGCGESLSELIRYFTNYPYQEASDES